MRSANPLPTTVEPTNAGRWHGFNLTSSLTTVPPYTVFGLLATVPFRTLVMKISAPPQVFTEVRSHGPLMLPPDQVSTGVPRC